MSDLMLDLDPLSATYQDLLLVGGDLVLTGDSTAAIRQDILTALRTFLGEWFMDLAIGVDFYGTILVKSPNQGKIDAILIAQILAVPGVLSLNAYRFLVNFTARKLTVTFTAQTTSGQVDYTGTV